MDIPTRTKFKDECFQIGTREHHLLSTLIDSRPLSPRNYSEANEGDIVFILFRSFAPYLTQKFHACLVKRNRDGLFIDDFSYHRDRKRRLEGYIAEYIRILEGPYSELHQLLEHPLRHPLTIANSNPHTSL